MKVRTFMAVAALAAGPVLAACSSGSGGAVASGAGDSGMASGQTGSPGSEAGASDASLMTPQDAGSTASNDSGLANSGDIFLSVTIAPGEGAPLAVNAITAAFIAGHKVVQPAVLLVEDAGASSCAVEQVPFPEPAAGGTQVSAGTITVTGGSATKTLMPVAAMSKDGGAAEGYLPLGNAGTISPGDTLTITASGATVPAFSASIAEPDIIAITEPELADASSFTFSRSSDLAVAWTGGGAVGSLTVAIGQIVGGTITTVACVFPESAGSGVIPAAALGLLMPSTALPGGALGGTSLTFTTSADQEVTAGDWTIAVSIQNSLDVGADTIVTVQ
jgi:hypothetical protein